MSYGVEMADNVIRPGRQPSLPISLKPIKVSLLTYLWLSITLVAGIPLHPRSHIGKYGRSTYVDTANLVKRVGPSPQPAETPSPANVMLPPPQCKTETTRGKQCQDYCNCKQTDGSFELESCNLPAFHTETENLNFQTGLAAMAVCQSPHIDCKCNSPGYPSDGSNAIIVRRAIPPKKPGGFPTTDEGLAQPGGAGAGAPKRPASNVPSSAGSDTPSDADDQQSEHMQSQAEDPQQQAREELEGHTEELRPGRRTKAQRTERQRIDQQKLQQQQLQQQQLQQISKDRLEPTCSDTSHPNVVRICMNTCDCRTGQLKKCYDRALQPDRDFWLPPGQDPDAYCKEAGQCDCEKYQAQLSALRQQQLLDQQTGRGSGQRQTPLHGHRERVPQGFWPEPLLQDVYVTPIPKDSDLRDIILKLPNFDSETGVLEVPDIAKPFCPGISGGNPRPEFRQSCRESCRCVNGALRFCATKPTDQNPEGPGRLLQIKTPGKTAADIACETKMGCACFSASWVTQLPPPPPSLKDRLIELSYSTELVNVIGLPKCTGVLRNLCSYCFCGPKNFPNKAGGEAGNRIMRNCHTSDYFQSLKVNEILPVLKGPKKRPPITADNTRLFCSLRADEGGPGCECGEGVETQEPGQVPVPVADTRTDRQGQQDWWNNDYADPPGKPDFVRVVPNPDAPETDPDHPDNPDLPLQHPDSTPLTGSEEALKEAPPICVREVVTTRQSELMPKCRRSCRCFEGRLQQCDVPTKGGEDPNTRCRKDFGCYCLGASWTKMFDEIDSGGLPGKTKTVELLRTNGWLERDPKDPKRPTCDGHLRNLCASCVCEISKERAKGLTTEQRKTAPRVLQGCNTSIFTVKLQQKILSFSKNPLDKLTGNEMLRICKLDALSRRGGGCGCHQPLPGISEGAPAAPAPPPTQGKPGGDSDEDAEGSDDPDYLPPPAGALIPAGSD